MKSTAEALRALSPEERKARIAKLSLDEAAALFHDWDFWARENQRLPGGNWRVWLLLAGRGYGKTRTLSETARIWAREFDFVNLIAPTIDDARDILIEGESGILAVCPKDQRPLYIASKRQLVWEKSGARSLIFTADEPDRLRGKQHAKLVCDELAAWRYPESWTQALLGLRLGRNPQVVAATTPRPTKLIKELIAHPLTITTRGSSYENTSYLPPAFLSEIISRYEGTRLGRQELLAELLSDNPGALWKRDQIDALRVEAAPPLTRVVVAADPAVTSHEDSDLTGIVVAGIAANQHFYVLDDLSLKGSPDTWASRVVYGYHKYRADRIVAETNNGGDLVEMALRTKDLHAAYKSVTASRGKIVRAEPIAALYEQGRVHHVGSFPKLEDEMCDYNPQAAGKSPDRMDALVWGLTELSRSALNYCAVVDFFEKQERDLQKLEKFPGCRETQLCMDAQGRMLEWQGRDQVWLYADTRQRFEGEEVHTGMKSVDEKAPTPPGCSALSHAALEGEECPKCGYGGIADLGTSGFRCGSCGHQWNPHKPGPYAGLPTRGDLIGDWRSALKKGFIIR